MSDHIKAALDAAAVVLVAEGVHAILSDVPGIREQWMNEPATPEARRQVAIAIAAFLRALPAPYTLAGAPLNWYAIPAEETRLWLANAVEAAGKENKE